MGREGNDQHFVLVGRSPCEFINFNAGAELKDRSLARVVGFPPYLPRRLIAETNKVGIAGASC